jgi:hypothetical protein
MWLDMECLMNELTYLDVQTIQAWFNGIYWGLGLAFVAIALILTYIIYLEGRNERDKDGSTRR